LAIREAFFCSVTLLLDLQHFHQQEIILFYRKLFHVLFSGILSEFRLHQLEVFNHLKDLPQLNFFWFWL